MVGKAHSLQSYESYDMAVQHPSSFPRAVPTAGTSFSTSVVIQLLGLRLTFVFPSLTTCTTPHPPSDTHKSKVGTGPTQ